MPIVILIIVLVLLVLLAVFTGVGVKLSIMRPKSDEVDFDKLSERHKIRYRRVLRSTVFTLVTVAAVAILVATLWMPVLQIYGASMTPTLTDGDIVISRKVKNLKQAIKIVVNQNALSSISEQGKESGRR